MEGVPVRYKPAQDGAWHWPQLSTPSRPQHTQRGAAHSARRVATHVKLPVALEPLDDVVHLLGLGLLVHGCRAKGRHAIFMVSCLSDSASMVMWHAGEPLLAPHCSTTALALCPLQRAEAELALAAGPPADMPGGNSLWSIAFAAAKYAHGPCKARRCVARTQQGAGGCHSRSTLLAPAPHRTRQSSPGGGRPRPPCSAQAPAGGTQHTAPGGPAACHKRGGSAGSAAAQRHCAQVLP